MTAGGGVIVIVAVEAVGLEASSFKDEFVGVEAVIIGAEMTVGDDAVVDFAV